MASARQAQLLEQRKMATALKAFQSNKRKVLDPNSLGSTGMTIARRTVEAESNSMLEQWKDGQISNEQLRDFLAKYQSNSTITPAEKVDVENRLRDLDDAIKTEKLEANYRTAAPGSMQKVQAAQALSTYYQQQAGGMFADTPAQSQAMQKAGDWQTEASNQLSKVQATQRATLRGQKMYEIAGMEDNSVEEVDKKIEVYTELASSARADGSEIEALKYDALAQAAIDKKPQVIQQTTSKEIKSYISDLENKYHDGEIDESQYLSNLDSVAQAVDDSGDQGLQRMFDRTVDRVYKIQQSGGATRGTTADGLPVVVGRGSGGEDLTDWDKEDFNYSDNLRLAYEMFSTGKIDGTKYAEALSQNINERNTQLEARYSKLNQIAQNNPNQKVTYKGRKVRAVDVLEDVYKEQGDMSGQIDAITSGTFAVLEVPPDQFNLNGKYKKSGRAVSTYTMVNKNDLPEDQYATDDSGVYHLVERGQKQITPDEMVNPAVVNNGVYTDPTTMERQYIQRDASGNPYVYTSDQKIRVFEPGSSKYSETPYVKGNPVQGYKAPPQPSETFDPTKPYIPKETPAPATVQTPQTTINPLNEDDKPMEQTDIQKFYATPPATQPATPQPEPVKTAVTQPFNPRAETEAPSLATKININPISSNSATMKPTTIKPIQPPKQSLGQKIGSFVGNTANKAKGWLNKNVFSKPFWT